MGRFSPQSKKRMSKGNTNLRTKYFRHRVKIIIRACPKKIILNINRRNMNIGENLLMMFLVRIHFQKIGPIRVSNIIRYQKQNLHKLIFLKSIAHGEKSMEK